MPPELPKIENSAFSSAIQSQEIHEADVLEAEQERLCREDCYAKIIELYPELTVLERSAILKQMNRTKAGSWSSYDDYDVRIKNVSVMNGVIRITFDLENLRIEVDELVIVE